MATRMTVERYAETRAEMEAGRLRDEVLMRAGIASDEWTAAERAWLDKMGTEIERGRFELTNQYTRAFLARQRALQLAAAAPTLKEEPLSMPVEALPLALSVALTPSLGADIGPAHTPAPTWSPPTTSAWSPVTDESPRAPAPILSPPMLAAPGETQPASFAANSFDAVQTLAPPPLVRVPDHKVLPFAKGQPNADMASATPAPASSSLEGTLPFDAFLNIKNIDLPFVHAPAAPGPEAYAALQGPIETLNLSPADATPFRQASRGPFGSSPAAAPDEFDATGTISIDNAKLVRARVTPFDRPEQPPSGSAPPSLRGPTPSPLSERAHSSPELPSSQSTEAMKAIYGFSLAQYAEICAAVTVYPDRVVQIRGHYGLDVHAWMALHELWQERFQRDPALGPRWEALVQAALARRPP